MKFLFILNNCLDIVDNDIISHKYIFLIKQLIENNNEIILISYKNIDYSTSDLLNNWLNDKKIIINYVDGLELSLKNQKFTTHNIFSFQLLNLIKKYINSTDLVVIDDIPYRSLLVGYLYYWNKPCLVCSFINIPEYIQYYDNTLVQRVWKNHNYFYTPNVINTTTSLTFSKEIDKSENIVLWPKIILNPEFVDIPNNIEEIIEKQRKDWKDDLGKDFDYFLLCVSEISYEKNIDKIIDIIPENVGLIIVAKGNNSYTDRLQTLVDSKTNIIMINEDIDNQQIKNYYISCDYTISASKAEVHDIYILNSYLCNTPAIVQPSGEYLDLIINNTNGIFLNFEQSKEVQIERLNFAFSRRKRLRGLNKIKEDYIKSTEIFYQNFLKTIINPCQNTQKVKTFFSVKIWYLIFYFYLLFNIYIFNIYIFYHNKINRIQIKKITPLTNKNEKYIIKSNSGYKINIYIIPILVLIPFFYQLFI